MATEIKYKNTAEVLIHAYRNFPPNTKFRSLFGAIDVVSETDSVRVDNFWDCYILCKSGEYRLIYNGSYWAEIL